jgi:hypothetical protein
MPIIGPTNYNLPFDRGFAIIVTQFHFLDGGLYLLQKAFQLAFAAFPNK